MKPHKSVEMFLGLLLITVSTLLFSGCAVTGDVVSISESGSMAPTIAAFKIPLKVGVIIPDENYSDIVTTRAIGSYTRPTPISIPFGRILKRKAIDVLSAYFDEAVIVQNFSESQGLDAYITPSVTSSQLDDVDTTGFAFFTSSRVDASLGLRIIMSAPSGETIWSKTIQSPKITGQEIKVIDRNQHQATAVSGTISEAVSAALIAAMHELNSTQEVRAYKNRKVESPQSDPKKFTSPNNTRMMDKPIASDLAQLVPTGKPAGKYDIAVIIGNANYAASDTPSIIYALNDAQIMKQYLVKSFGYDPANIIYVENATLTKLNEIFGTSEDYQGKLFKWVKPGQSKIFIYYVGHGVPDQQSGEGYFVPVDANPQYISTSGYKLSTFYENLSKIPAVKKTVVIDACFSGSSANGQLFKGVSGLTARLKAEPKAAVAADLLLTSAGMNQVASWYPEKGHSLFTYFFLKGIQGEADTNKDGRITMGEMKVWLNEQVPYMARRITGNQQQPVMLGKDGDELVTILH